MLVLRRRRRREVGKRKRARRDEQSRLHVCFSGEGGDARKAPPPRSRLLLVMLGMAFMLGHVLAAVLAAIRLLFGGLLLPLGGRSSRLSDGSRRRDHQRHHD
jgi:hypothetical protein